MTADQALAEMLETRARDKNLFPIPQRVEVEDIDAWHAAISAELEALRAGVKGLEGTVALYKQGISVTHPIRHPWTKL